MSGLLIVNADDWGGFPEATDAIERCFAAGAITSSTALMFFADAARAAEVARAGGRPIGLHLNLTQPFDAPDVPPAVRERQRMACARFSDLRRRRWTYDPRPRGHRLLRDCVADQLEEFHRRYEREPTHVDSHHHVHVCPDVLLALPRGLKVRQTRTDTLGGRIKAPWLARRFTTTAAFVPIDRLLDDAAAREAVVERSRREPVEVMCHPSFPHELPFLLGDEWHRAMASAPAASYESLRP